MSEYGAAKRELAAVDIGVIANQIVVKLPSSLADYVPVYLQQMLIRYVLSQLIPVLPNDVAAFLLDAVDGLTLDEIAAHEDNLVVMVNKAINLPFIGEEAESHIIKPVVHALLMFAVPGRSLYLG